MAELVVPADTQSSDFSLAFNNVSFSDGILTFEIMAEPWTEESTCQNFTIKFLNLTQNPTFPSYIYIYIYIYLVFIFFNDL
ncbi:hypothetical protein AMTRI_Chr01g105260 [Amborella trichopoda]